MTCEGSVTREGLEDRGCALKGKKLPFFGFHWPQIHQIWAKLPVKGKNEAVFAFHFVQDDTGRMSLNAVMLSGAKHLWRVFLWQDREKILHFVQDDMERRRG